MPTAPTAQQEEKQRLGTAQDNPASLPGAADAQPVGASSYPDLRALQIALRETTDMREP